MKVFVLGATGLVGHEVFSQCLAKNYDVVTVTRRALEGGKNVVEANTDQWPAIIEQEAVGATAFISGFGTTRAKAGGMDNFRKIDYGVNYAAAQAAKKAGVLTFVLVLSGGALALLWFPYLALKGKLEDDIVALGFEKTVILRPGALTGHRADSHGWLNDIFMSLADKTRGTPLNFLTMGIAGADVAKIAVHEAAQAKDGVTYIGPFEMISLAGKL